MTPKSAMAAMMRLVAMGRRIKVSDMFTPGYLLRAGLAAYANATRSSCLHGDRPCGHRAPRPPAGAAPAGPPAARVAPAIHWDRGHVRRGLRARRVPSP